jgi:two-component system LytT family sensor kinase
MTSPSAEPRWSLSGRELFLIALFWTSIASLSAVNRLIDPRGLGFRGIGHIGPIAFPFVEAAVWFALTPLIFYLAHRMSLQRSSWLWRVPLLLVVGLIVAVFVDLVLDLARQELMLRRRAAIHFSPMRAMGRLRFINQFIVFGAVLAAGFAREYFLRDRHQREEREKLMAESARLQAQLAEARLDALRMQINPHFLFNTLHAVSALVERDPAGVRRMIARLSELLRQTLDRRGSDEVTLERELAFLQSYIDIMTVRFQGKLDVKVDVAPDVREVDVPSFILQPLVENALEHGAGASGSALVEITARAEGEKLVVTVADGGPGVIGSSESGVGLRNTRDRLRQHYGDAAGVDLADRPGGGAVATLTIPMRRRSGVSGS